MVDGSSRVVAVGHVGADAVILLFKDLRFGICDIVPQGEEVAAGLDKWESSLAFGFPLPIWQDKAVAGGLSHESNHALHHHFHIRSLISSWTSVRTWHGHHISQTRRQTCPILLAGRTRGAESFLQLGTIRERETKDRLGVASGSILGEKPDCRDGGSSFITWGAVGARTSRTRVVTATTVGTRAFLRWATGILPTAARTTAVVACSGDGGRARVIAVRWAAVMPRGWLGRLFGVLMGGLGRLLLLLVLPLGWKRTRRASVTCRGGARAGILGRNPTRRFGFRLCLFGGRLALISRSFKQPSIELVHGVEKSHRIPAVSAHSLLIFWSAGVGSLSVGAFMPNKKTLNHWYTWERRGRCPRLTKGTSSIGGVGSWVNGYSRLTAARNGRGLALLVGIVPSIW
jgi:hypothetical protein